MQDYDHCELCAAECFLQPATEQIFEEQSVTTHAPVKDADGHTRVEYSQVIQKKPKIVEMPFYNSTEKKMSTQKVPAFKDLAPRGAIFTLQHGRFFLQKFVCMDCLESVKPEIESIQSKFEEK